jgi:hypothetical protein
MPTLEHNALVEMFRDNPALVARLLAQILHAPVPEHSSIVVVEAALDQLLPVEFRADLVFELRNAVNKLLLAIVLEVQRESDADKKFSWPVYVTVLRARKRCPACVLVIAPDASVATWAAKPIQLGLGPGDGTVKPWVLGPAQLPRVTDPAVAAQEPELSVLSARAHGNEPDGFPVVRAALAGLEGLDPNTAAVYFQLIYDALREPMRSALEALIMANQQSEDVTWPPFMQRLIDRGEAAAMRKWMLKGKHEGKHEAKREMIVKLALRAGIALTEEERARIEKCDDLATLDRWIDNALTSKTAVELFA